MRLGLFKPEFSARCHDFLFFYPEIFLISSSLFVYLFLLPSSPLYSHIFVSISILPSLYFFYFMDTELPQAQASSFKFQLYKGNMAGNIEEELERLRILQDCAR